MKVREIIKRGLLRLLRRSRESNDTQIVRIALDFGMDKVIGGLPWFVECRCGISDFPPVLTCSRCESEFGEFMKRV